MNSEYAHCRLATTYHEAGHAVAALAVGYWPSHIEIFDDETGVVTTIEPNRSSRIGTPPESGFADTERAYGGREAYDRAKSSGKTDLNYRQWVQVRTPKFKAWFGDWEALRVQQKLDEMEAVKIRIPDEWRALSKTELRQRVESALNDLRESNLPLRHPDIGDVSLEKRGIKKALSSSADTAKLYLLGDLRKAFQSSLFASAAHTNDKPNIDAYEKLLVRLDIGGSNMVAIFTVERDRSGRQFYNAVTLENEKTPAVSLGDTLTSEERAAPANTGVESFIRQPLRRVNPDSASKAINLKTGEPLVVYHGTVGDFDAFRDRGKSPLIKIAKALGLKKNDGYFFFALNSEFANSYAGLSGAIEGGNVMPVYLSIKNPLIDKRNGGESVADAMKRARKDGYDGLNVKNWSEGMGRNDGSFGAVESEIYIALNNTQIKSAIGNNGDFDSGNPSTLFSRKDDSLADNSPTEQDRLFEYESGEQEKAKPNDPSPKVQPALFKPSKSMADIQSRILGTPESKMTTGQKLKTWFKEKIDLNADELKQTWLDGFHAVKAMEEGLFGNVLDASLSAWRSIHQAQNIGAVMEAVLEKGSLEWHQGAARIRRGSKGLMDIFAPLRDADLMMEWEL